MVYDVQFPHLQARQTIAPPSTQPPLAPLGPSTAAALGHTLRPPPAKRQRLSAASAVVDVTAGAPSHLYNHARHSTLGVSELTTNTSTTFANGQGRSFSENTPFDLQPPPAARAATYGNGFALPSSVSALRADSSTSISPNRSRWTAGMNPTTFDLFGSAPVQAPQSFDWPMYEAPTLRSTSLF
jgi:hypothetical protein